MKNGVTPGPAPVEKQDMAGRPPLQSDRMTGRTIQKRYVIQELIGQGGMGKIYSALDLNSQSKVAIKIMHTSDPAARERFLTEAKAMADIRHKNVIRIFAADDYEGKPYMVMEFLEGHDLKDYLKRTGPLKWGDARRILLGVCDGIEAAHAKGIMHRDLKPQNIFISNDGGAKVLDLGLAKFMDREDGPHTVTGMFAGTPEYAAPEQMTDRKNMDHRVDIYALGIIMYNILTGGVPFSSDKADQEGANLEVLMKQINEPPLPPNIKYPGCDIPREVEDIILKAIQKKKEDRYNDIGELRDAILHCEGISTGISLGDVLLVDGLDTRVRTPEPVAAPKSGHGIRRTILLTAGLISAVLAYTHHEQLEGDYELAKASGAKIAARIRSTVNVPQDTAPQKQEPIAAPPQDTFTIKIESNLPCRVYDVTSENNAIDLGFTPLTKKLANGEHKLLIKSKDKQEKRLVVSPEHTGEMVVFEKPKKVTAKATATEDTEGDKAAEDDDSKTEGAPADDNDTPTGTGTEDPPSN